MLQVGADELELSPYYGKVHCERTWKWNTRGRPFDDYDLWYVWSGAGEIDLNGVSRSVQAGSCFLFRPGDETVGWHNPACPLTVTYIHFRMPVEASAVYPVFLEVSDRLAFETYLNRYTHSRMSSHPDKELEARHLLFLLLLLLLREAKEAQDSGGRRPEDESDIRTVVHEVAAYVRQFPGMEHSVAALAERARLSPRYFSRKFRAIMGRTPEAYVIDMKIERAEHLLRYYGMNVGEVADALGYGNIYYFSRQFKQYRGIAPSELRGK